MKPEHFNQSNPDSMVYYSMQNPSTFTFSPSSRNTSSTLLEMRELQHLMSILKDELSEKNIACNDTELGNAARNSEFIYFHNKPDKHKVIDSSNKIIHYDKRLLQAHAQHPDARFACDAPFMRGCILIKNKE